MGGVHGDPSWLVAYLTLSKLGFHINQSPLTPPAAVDGLLLLTLCLFAARWLLYLFSSAITLVTALMNWPPVFHLQWLGHVPHARQHLPTTIVWNSPMQELIGSVMVSSPMLPALGTLSLLVFPASFNLPFFKRQVYHHLRDQMA